MFLCFCLPVAAVQVDVAKLQEQMDVIREAAGLDSFEKLAYALEIDVAQFRRQLQGEGHVSLTRIVAQLAEKDPKFLPRYGWLLVCRYGLPREAKRSAMAALALIGRKRMVRMSAAHKPPQKRSA